MSANVISLVERREARRPKPATRSTSAVVLNPMFWPCVWGGTVFAVTLAALESWSAR
jgi:hypothetical protein